ncbi:hypothetical protein BKI52_31285 [marine bacterium AO1-C]|nr:hypothetical protein BKI52_31285 [marine bacterium AO1-C]
MFRKILLGFFVLLTVLVVVLVINAYRTSSRQIEVKAIPSVDIPANAFEHLSKAITLRTISYSRTASVDTNAFKGLHRYFKSTFPLVHSQLKREVINELSLLYTWKGTDSRLKPVLLTAHLDVVPIEKGTEQNWTHPPFSGNINGGYIWGRGALDDKMNALGMLEAVEYLLKKGYTPKRTILLAFGHDEEVSGYRGAQKIADHLAKRNTKLEYVLDEGLFILEGQMPGVAAPVAYVGVAEKGYANVKISVASPGGHSSRPTTQTAVGILSQAIVNLEKEQFDASIEGATKEMMDYLAPEMSTPYKLAFANRWLFNPVIKKIMLGKSTTSAVLRTTTAPTILKGSPKSNVLPANPSAIINLRLKPGETKATILRHFKDAIGDDRVKVEIQADEFNLPVPMSDLRSKSFKNLQKTIRQLFPESVVAPALMVGGTDSKYYRDLSKNIFRFTPLLLPVKDIDGLHGTNERVSKKGYQQLIRFYVQLIKNSD